MLHRRIYAFECVPALLICHPTTYNRTLTLTLEYCKTFGGVKPADEEGANQYLTNLRQVLEQWEFGGAEDTPYKKSLHPFEVAALANLMTTSSDRDEACTC